MCRVATNARRPPPAAAVGVADVVADGAAGVCGVVATTDGEVVAPELPGDPELEHPASATRAVATAAVVARARICMTED
jgi:hypothetical protein